MTTKKKRIITLGSVGAGLLVIMSAVQIAAGMQAKNLDLLFPGDVIVNDDGSGLSGDYIDFEYDSQEDALKNAQQKTQLTAEEGMTLLDIGCGWGFLPRGKPFELKMYHLCIKQNFCGKTVDITRFSVYNNRVALDTRGQVRQKMRRATPPGREN